MKETGVVRRLDELGRVVIPKEIRKRLKIDNSDLVDIFTEEDRIVLKKYHPLNYNIPLLSNLCDSVKVTYGCDIVVCDKVNIIYNTIKEELNNMNLDKELLNRIDSYLEKEISSLVKLNLTDNYVINKDMIIYPLVINNEKYGYLFILDGIISKRQKELGLFITKFLNQIL